MKDPYRSLAEAAVKDAADLMVRVSEVLPDAMSASWLRTLAYELLQEIETDEPETD